MKSTLLKQLLALLGILVWTSHWSDAARGEIVFADDFNRADGPVGNGWNTFLGSEIGASEIQIENGQLRSTGFPLLAGGVFREMPVDFSANPIRFRFQFRTADPTTGGWYIGFNSLVSNSEPYTSPTQVAFFQWSGVGQVGRNYLNSQGDMSYNNFLPTQPGQRNFQSDLLATISGTINADLSATIHVEYNDGLSPAIYTYAFDEIADRSQMAPGGSLVFGNSSAFAGPYFSDNLSITTVPEPTCAAVVGMAFSMVALRRRTSRSEKS